MKKQQLGARDASILPASPAIRLNPLEELQQRAMIDGREEAAFFRALLDATVYAHSPQSDDSGRVRFFQFIRPDNGVTVLPFFTDRGKADAVGRTDAKTIALTGRQLFERTLGATLMLNPNDAHCVLYPEEIAVRADLSISVATQGIIPVSSSTCLVHAVSVLPYIQSAYLLETLVPDALTDVTLLVVLEVEPSLADRAVRAVSSAMQHRWNDMRTNVDMTAFDPAGEPPDWVTAVGLPPIYQRPGRPDAPKRFAGRRLP